MKWQEFKQKRAFKGIRGELFTNVNRFGRTFIRAVRDPYATKTFNCSAKGYAAALRSLSGQEVVKYGK